MRRRIAVIAACLLLAPAAAPADAAGPTETRKSLNASMAAAGSSSGALVVDLDTGRTVFARRAGTDRIPASNEKLFVTAATLLELGAGNRPDTVAQVATEPEGDTVDGDLYLRGNGDPSLTSADLRSLAATIRRAGVRRITGRVVGDESLFDRLRGVGATGYGPSIYLNPIGALMMDRGRTGRLAPYYQRRPATFAAAYLTSALRSRGVRVAKSASTGRVPDDAVTIAAEQAPTYAELSAQTNVPSDNTIAETLLKAVGTDGFTRQGTTARGRTVTERALRDAFGISPKIADGSGLSRYNRSSPRDVLGMLQGIRETDVSRPFYDSLAVAGRSGTLASRMRSSAARDRCRGKTGTLSNVSALSGYCTTRAGKTIAFSILMNRVNPSGAQVLQDRMVDAIVRYTDV